MEPILHLRACPAFPAKPLQPASDLLSQKGQPLYAHSYRFRRVAPVPETCLGVAPNSLVQQSVPACPTCSRVRAGATKVETQSSCACGYYSTARILTQGFLMLKGPGSHRRECRSPLAKIPPSRWLRLNPMIGANPDKYWHQCPERH